MELLKQEITTFTSSNITELVLPWSAATNYNPTITAGAFVIGLTYRISTIGTTNFTLIGATANTIGLEFVATGIGSGTGTAIRQDFVLLGTYIYKCVSSHIDKTPENNIGIYWSKWSISNKGAMLDLSAQSKSYFNGGNLVVTFPQNRMNTLAIGNYEALTVLVEVLDAIGTVLWSYTTLSSINNGVIDYWSYIYQPYGYEIDRGIKITIGNTTGTSIRVTFNKSTEATRTACGYLVGGTAYSMGCTMQQVSFKFNSFAVKSTDDFGTLSIIKRAVQDVVDFETIVDNTEIPTMRRKIKEVYNDIIVFIVDESETSNYENLLTLGTIESSSVVLTEFYKSHITWSVVEAI